MKTNVISFTLFVIGSLALLLSVTVKFDAADISGVRHRAFSFSGEVHLGWLAVGAVLLILGLALGISARKRK